MATMTKDVDGTIHVDLGIVWFKMTLPSLPSFASRRAAASDFANGDAVRWGDNQQGTFVAICPHNDALARVTDANGRTVLIERAWLRAS